MGLVNSCIYIYVVDFSPMPVILNPNQGFKSGSYITGPLLDVPLLSFVTNETLHTYYIVTFGDSVNTIVVRKYKVCVVCICSEYNASVYVFLCSMCLQCTYMRTSLNKKETI